MASEFIERVPPHNDEAEQAVLGALLLDEDAIEVASQIIHAEDFYTGANRRIYQAVLDLSSKGSRADIITVSEHLKQKGELESSGGPAYIASLTNVVPTSANTDYYAKIILDCSIRRALIRISSELTRSSFNSTSESNLILEDAQRQIFDLGDKRQTLSYKSAREIIPKTIEIIENLYQTKDPFTGVASGLDDLDAMTNGFQKSELIIIGARPSMGKTALALTIAGDMSIRQKIPNAFFSLEMSDLALMNRIIAMEARINSENLRTGLLKPSDLHALMEAASRIYEAPLYIVDMPGLKLMDLRSQARRMKAQLGIKAIFVDYITLITSDNTSIPRHEQISEISRSLKALARELEIPVIALSQVRRDAEGKKPGLSDIRESGSIEQDADLVIFLHRERGEERKSSEDRQAPVPTELIVAKQRNGPVGTVDIIFLPQYTKFATLSKTDR